MRCTHVRDDQGLGIRLIGPVLLLRGPGVTLVMTDEQGAEYIRIADGDLGPELAIAAP